MTEEALFWTKVDRSDGPDACWPILGFRDKDGYGQARLNGRKYRAHRLAWELAFGPIPGWTQVLHHCDNPPCCNPAHLFLGTQSDNRWDCVTKGRDANVIKTHCPQGHLYAPSNTYIDQQGWRECRTCARERMRRFRESNREEVYAMKAQTAVGVVLSTLTGLLLTGTIPATAAVTATVFALAVTTTLFGGDPRRIVSAVLGAAQAVSDAVDSVVESATESDETE